LLLYHTQSMAKSRNLNIICFLIILLVLPDSINAQGLFSRKQTANQYTTVGLGFGSSHYGGDLTPQMLKKPHFLLYKNVRWNIHGHYTRHFNPNTALRLQFSWVRLLGNDNSYTTDSKGMIVTGMQSAYIRNLHFRNDVKEMTISGIFNLIPNYSKSSPRERLAFTPYITVGAGFISHQPKAKRPIISPDEKVKYSVNLRDLGTEGQNLPNSTSKVYSLVVPVIPIGFGMKWKVNDKIDFSMEANLRYVFSDFLDDVGFTRYPDQATLNNYNPESAIFSYRADEPLNAVTGQNRFPNIQQIYEARTGNSSNGLSIQQMVSEIGYNTSSPNVLRGGTPRNDLYGTFQFTLSYILSEKIKCPVPK
jgi:hypothetical protein